MAIWGIGAYYQNDVTEEFLNRGIACIGWNINEAPALHNELRYLKVGDVIYIKSFTPNTGLTIKAIGIVLNAYIEKRDDMGDCLTVKWLWQGEEKIGKVDEKLNVRNNTLYEEYNPEIQGRVIKLLLEEFNRPH